MTAEEKKAKKEKLKLNKKKEKKAAAAATGGSGGGEKDTPPPAPHGGAAPPRKLYQVSGTSAVKCYLFQTYYHGRSCTDVTHPKRGCKFTHEECLNHKDFRT